MTNGLDLRFGEYSVKDGLHKAFSDISGGYSKIAGKLDESPNLRDGLLTAGCFAAISEMFLASAKVSPDAQWLYIAAPIASFGAVALAGYVVTGVSGKVGSLINNWYGK